MSENISNFEKWNDRYKNNWCTKDQLKRLVGLNILTEIEYHMITGEVYVK